MPQRRSTLKKNMIGKILKHDVVNMQGEVVEKMALPISVFDVEPNPSLLAQYLRVYSANQRLGTAATKTRSNVSGSTKKIYRQKGTGRARHGDRKAPIFSGGGIAHGPHPKDWGLGFPKRMKQLALRQALTDALRSQKIKIIKGLNELSPKTKQMKLLLTNLQVIKKDIYPKTLLITANDSANILLAGRNLPYLKITSVIQINTYDVLNHKQLVIMKDAIKKLAQSEKGQDQDGTK